ncbi:hypothetical protein BGZ79_002704 [Entomortierella chlamydospora]|nr:hypothetical protein BGZ79_002704 [Entomortierella chlamydospora]
MEILRENFHAELPYIKEAIEECEFIAIDAEFSGLHTEPNRRTQKTTLEQGYEELRKSASQFLTVQIGISTFKFDPRNGDYVAKPFNFFVFPTTLAGYSPQGRCFLAEASSLDFLAKNDFDFNKWIHHGVQYMTKDEEESYRKERMKYLNNEYDDIAIDPVHEEWLNDAIERIAAWKENPEAINFINIQTANNYQKRLIHQEVRRLWGTELHAQGAVSFITITKAVKTTEKVSNDIRNQKQAGIQGLSYDTSLSALENMVSSIHFMGCPRVVPNARHTRYLSRDRSHEAGYDSYITGFILIRMLAHITRSELPPPQPKPQPIREKHSKKPRDKAERNARGDKRGGRNKSQSHDPSHAGKNASTQVPASGSQKNGQSAGPSKKPSYADAVHGSKNKSQKPPGDSLVDAQQHQTSPKSGENNGYRDDYYEYSEDEYNHESVPEDFDKPFSIDAPHIKRYQNILYWGRSNHGCINLTNS